MSGLRRRVDPGQALIAGSSTLGRSRICPRVEEMQIATIGRASIPRRRTVAEPVMDRGNIEHYGPARQLCERTMPQVEGRRTE